MQPANHSNSNRVFLTAAGLAASFTIAAVFLANWDDALQRNSLFFLKSPIDTLIPIIAPLEKRCALLLNYVQEGLLWIAGLVLLSACIWRRNVSVSSATLVLASLAAVHGQLAIALHDNLSGLGAFVLAFVLLLFFIGMRAAPEESPLKIELKPFGLSECCVFLGLFTIALILRFYALNRILHFFEGELSPFAAAANDLRGMCRANVGHNGPWSPFGFNFYLLVYATTHLVGTKVLALRLSTAIPAMAMIFLGYFFLRNIFSRAVAVVGILVLAVDSKQISWSRFEFPHHGPALPAMLICWLTYLSFESKRLIFPLILILIMGYSFHQYPSGQSSLLIPWGYLAYLLFVNRSHSWKFYTSRVLFFGMGTALWYYGHSLAMYCAYQEWHAPSYLARFDGRVSWKTLGENQSFYDNALHMLGMYGANFVDLFGSMIVQLRHGHPPQELTPSFDGLTQRTIFILVPPMVAVAIACFFRRPKWKEGALLLVWIVVGSLPAILSDAGYSRRAASIFPALMFLGAAGYAITRQAVADFMGSSMRFLLLVPEVTLAVCLLLATVQQFFSGQNLPFKEPQEEILARRISPFITPGTLVYIDSEDNYMDGKLTYLMLDYLDESRNRPIGWIVLNDNLRDQFQTLINDPRWPIRYLRDSIFYDWTKLFYHLPQIESFNSWQKLTYISVRFPNSPLDARNRTHFEMMKDACVTSPEHVEEIRIPDMYQQVYLFSCLLKLPTTINPPT